MALAQGPWAAGVSYMRGAYDPEDRYEYRAWGFDASAYFRGAQVRAVGAKSQSVPLGQSVHDQKADIVTAEAVLGARVSQAEHRMYGVVAAQWICRYPP